MEWLNHNWVNILAIIGAADALFYAVTKLTKSTADDNVYAMIHGWVIKFFQPKQ
jgi:hypothetical protein